MKWNIERTSSGRWQVELMGKLGSVRLTEGTLNMAIKDAISAYGALTKIEDERTTND